MQSLYDVPAPAKLNLFLHITGRRPDGYHTLQSAFVLIDWCDTLHFERRSGAQLSREDLTHPLPADDLVLRAARALQAATHCTEGAHIQIAKSIPAQAGMGGGSSDAATTLLALNRLWNLNLSIAQLQTIGLQLGADVPFFLEGSCAWVEGIGERMTAFTMPLSQILVAKPERGLDTATIFSDPQLKRDTEPATISDFAADVFGFGRNDLQPVAQALCPDVKNAIDWLQSKGLHARMTGSGSAVFAHCVHTPDLSDVPATLQVRLCQSMNHHPLRAWGLPKS